MVDPTLTSLANRFRRFAEQECDDLPMYRRLCEATANDRESLELLASAREHQARPTLLLAAVHDLLLAGTPHELAAWYPTVTDPPTTGADPFPAFRDFIATHTAEVGRRVRTRSTQTNEVGRSWWWRLAIPVMVADLGGPLVAVLELGASAGLNLAFDRYHYVLDGHSLGTETGVVLSTRSQTSEPPVHRMPRVAARLGVDLEPVSLQDADAVRWLKACIWPEQPGRHRRFDAAVEMVRRDPPRVIADDLVDGLSDAIAELPASAHLVVINSWTLGYLPPHRRQVVDTTLDLIGQTRDLTWLSAESGRVHTRFPLPTPTLSTPVQDPTVLVASRWRAGRRRDTLLARCQHHGDWIEWLT